MINEEIIETIAELRHFVCYHNEFLAAYEGVLGCMSRSISFNRPIGCLLLGKGGVGKSTVCKLIKAKNKPEAVTTNGYVKRIVKVFYMPVPSPVTIKSLTIRMLEELGSNDHSGTSEQLNYRLRTLLRECNTKLIMLDEFHHIYNANALKTRSTENVANWIKTLADESKVTICLVGLPDIQSKLHLDSQLQRRFSYVYTLNPLSLSENSAEIFKNFLKHTEEFCHKKLATRFDPSLISHSMLKRIYLATGGIQAYVIQLIQESCIKALSSQRKVVTIDDFHYAFSLNSTIYLPLTKKAVFLISQAELNNIVESTI
jgi:hypothetical protein